MSFRAPIMAVFLSTGFLSFVSGQSNREAPVPKFSELSRENSARLEKQRAVIVAAAQHRYGTKFFTRTQSDLPVLQNLIDDRIFNRSQTYELQSLGVVFGDVLASELPLRWVMVTDEYGTDPTLRYEDTALQINALTMISKRVDKNEAVNLSEFLRITREQLAKYEKLTRVTRPNEN
jgi:hypothetical protein